MCVCLKGAVELNPTRDDKSPDEVPYGMVVGQVTPESHSLTSNFNREYRGVIRVCEVKEHRVRFSNDMKTNSERTLSKDIDFEPYKDKDFDQAQLVSEDRGANERQIYS